MANKKIRLGVNIDHVAFIKTSRNTMYPNLLDAVRIAEEAGADLITIHLREDRRHIQDNDALDIRKFAKILNFEMANTNEMIKFAMDLKPDFCCIVPEKREEKTTEGGLSLKTYTDKQLILLEKTISDFKLNDIKTSLFIDPNTESIDIAKNVGADLVELHTGRYANFFNEINIGHAIIAQAVFTGLKDAIKKIISIINNCD